MKGKCNLTLFAGDSTAPRGKRRDFLAIGDLQRMFRDENAERLKLSLCLKVNHGRS